MIQIVMIYYLDFDGDGFGDVNMALDTCVSNAPIGFVTNLDDCDDSNDEISPSQEEICDNYLDFDGDGFGDVNMALDTCISNAPIGFVTNLDDCNDDAADINPLVEEIPDNGIDEDCSGYDLYNKTQFLPNNISSMNLADGSNIEIRYNYSGQLTCELYSTNGKLIASDQVTLQDNFFSYSVPSNLIGGIYILKFYNEDDKIEEITKVFVH